MSLFYNPEVVACYSAIVLTRFGLFNYRHTVPFVERNNDIEVQYAVQALNTGRPTNYF